MKKKVDFIWGKLLSKRRVSGAQRSVCTLSHGLTHHQNLLAVLLD